MKKLVRIVLGLVVVLIAAVVVGVLFIDSIAKTAVEKGSSYALGVNTKVDSMSVSLIRGQSQLTGLQVANPQGFQSPYFVHTGRFDIGLRPASLFGDTVELRQFELDGLEMHVEQKGASSNVGAIMDSLERFGSKEQTEPQDKKEGKKVKVDKIVIRNVVAHFHLLAGLPGAEKGIVVKVPEIVLKDLTSDNAGGVVLPELIGRIVPIVVASVLENAKGLVPGDVLTGLNGQVGEAVQALGKEAQKAFGKALGGIEINKDLKGTVDKAKGVLDGLLGGKK